MSTLLAPSASADSHVLRAAPPCIYEDGSGQTECVWNAKVRGNGKGTSLILTTNGPDHAVPITHKKARKLIRRWRADNCVKVTRRDYVCRGWNRG